MICPFVNIGFKAYETEKYSTVTGCDLSTRLPINGHNLIFRSGLQKLATLEADGTFTIKKHYASDGYSPCIKVLGSWKRITPIPKRAGLFPALLHDVLRQFCTTPGCPWDRKFSDTMFYNALIAGGESKGISGTYYGAVSRVVGNLYFRLFHKADPQLSIELI